MSMSGDAKHKYATRVLTLEANKSLDGLQEDTDAERQQEDSVEKRAEEGGTLPAER